MDYKKKYKDLLEQVRKIHTLTKSDQDKGLLEKIFPELQESENEKIRKEIIEFLEQKRQITYVPYEWTDWLKEQGKTDISINWHDVSEKPEKNREVLCEWVGSNNCIWHDVTFYNPTNEAFWSCGRQVDYVTRWCYVDELEQYEQKPLYIRFGDIPNNEQSKIYNGENEVGVENGVSVYPAFINGDNIILGLTLPITKTTLYTQQHLLEYDTRPCYLVTGNCVGKGTDGEPLIKNINIIKEIKGYRVKELEEQGEKIPTDDVEPKFHEGDWVACEELNTAKIINIVDDRYEVEFIDGNKGFPHIDYIDKNFHPWTLQDAKNGDVLCCKSGWTCIFKSLVNDETFSSYCFMDKTKRFYEIGSECHTLKDEFVKAYNGEIYPATKEQRELLFKEMKKNGYGWDSENKQLKMVDDKEYVDDKTYNDEDYGSDGLYHALDILERTLGKVTGYQPDDGIIDHKCAINTIKKLYNQKNTWSEEDEGCYNSIIEHLKYSITNGKPETYKSGRLTDWLHSLKERYTWKPSKEQMDALDEALGLAKSCGEECAFHIRTLYEQLKKLKA